jgi:hypothetical protein
MKPEARQSSIFEHFDTKNETVVDSAKAMIDRDREPLPPGAIGHCAFEKEQGPPGISSGRTS